MYLNYISGLLPGSSKSFLKDFSNTYISAVGVSFYENCVPPESYHLGFAASCFHWLRKKPANLKNVIHHTLSTDSAELESLAKQAAEDWEEILLKRAEELKKGISIRDVIFYGENFRLCHQFYGLRFKI